PPGGWGSAGRRGPRVCPPTPSPQLSARGAGSFASESRPRPPGGKLQNCRAARRERREGERGTGHDRLEGGRGWSLRGSLAGPVEVGATGADGGRPDRTGEPADRLPRSGNEGGGRGGWWPELPRKRDSGGAALQKKGGMYRGEVMTTIPGCALGMR